MTNEEAIADIRDNIKPVVGGISLDMAIQALSQQTEDARIDGVEEQLEILMEGDKRTMSNRFHDGEDGRYYDGYYDGIYASLKIIREKQK